MAQLAPFTLDGWYALHQVFDVDWRAAGEHPRRHDLAHDAAALMARLAAPAAGGWSAAYRIIGGGDLMVVHFRASLEEIGCADLQLRRSPLGTLLRTASDFTSVTEAALYHATHEAALTAAPGSAAHDDALHRLVEAERGGPRMAQRLFPQPPVEMRYISFYPVSRRRNADANWYLLPLEERLRLMADHGLTGRRYAGRIVQVITGATGLDDWEWGVTLFSSDPLHIKRIVTDMRFDEASARYADFGPCFIGYRLDPSDWLSLLDGTDA